MASKSTDAQPLSTEQAEELYTHIRAIEALKAEQEDIGKDIAERKKLCTENLPIQSDVLDFVLKRRKHSKGTVGNFDTMLEYVEEAIAEVEKERASKEARPNLRQHNEAESSGHALQ